MRPLFHIRDLEYRAACAALDEPPTTAQVEFLVKECQVPPEYAPLFSRGQIMREALALLSRRGLIQGSIGTCGVEGVPGADASPTRRGPSTELLQMLLSYDMIGGVGNGTATNDPAPLIRPLS